MIFDHDEEWVRLDRWLTEHDAGLTVDRRLDLVRELADTMRHAHPATPRQPLHLVEVHHTSRPGRTKMLQVKCRSGGPGQRAAAGSQLLGLASRGLSM